MISTKGRYALRVILDLAQNSTGEYVPLKDIAERQDISLKYLEIIIKTLVYANMLVGLRGKGGGYKLVREPKDYTVGEILELCEGTLAPVACLQSTALECPRKGQCNTLPLWSRFDAMVHDFFYGITIQDIIDGKDFSDSQ